ncbi:ABC transporter ATP-binding protein [Nocardiopsis alba]|uniref:ABC transporter ATP-binding protein n=1 Tax=Nocardiopsis alba TaxID=53437 RepID=UPI00340FECEC
MTVPTTLPVADYPTTWREIRGLLREHRRPVALLLALNAAAVLAGLAAPFLLGLLVNDVVAGETGTRLDWSAGLIATSVAVHAVLIWLTSRHAFVFGEKVFAQLRERFAHRLLELPLNVVERAGTGDVVSRTTRDINAVSDFVRTGFPEVLVGLLSVTFTFGAALLVNWKVALCVGIGLPLIALSTRWFTRQGRTAFERELATAAAMNTTIIETVQGARTVDALDRVDSRKRTMLSAIRTARKAESVPLRLRTIWFPIVQVGYELPLVAVLVFGGWLVTQGQAGIGEVATIALFVRQMVTPMDDLIYWYGEAQLGLAAFARIIGVGRAGPEPDTSGAVPSGSELVLRDVRFAYRENRDVIRSVSLTVDPGERIAVVGMSGAGKSTLGLMIAGVYRPRSGSIRYGGVEVSSIPSEALRENIAMITQDTHLFAGSIADNLRLGRPDADDAALRAALATVGAAGWIDALDDGLSTEVGEDGAELAPAQAQQLALARIVLRDPRVLVLDEATSLVSADSVRGVERSVAGALEGRTVIAIAHRLGSAVDADRVVVMHDGEIVEVGPHTDLVSAGGPYTRLWNSYQENPEVLHADG